MARLMGSNVTLPLHDDPEGERQLSAMCATCAKLLLRDEDFLPRPFTRPGTIREERDALWADRAFVAIEAESACPLCRLIVYALRTSNFRPVPWEQIRCTLYMNRFSSFWDHEEGRESFRFLTAQGCVQGRQYSVSRRTVFLAVSSGGVLDRTSRRP